MIVLIVMLILIIPLDYFAQIKGFANEQSETKYVVIQITKITAIAE